MQHPVVVITDTDLPIDRADIELMRAAGLDVHSTQCRTAEEVVEAAKDASALLVQWTPITVEVLDKLKQLRFISRLGIGYDMIDVDAATKRGIAVANTPNYCIEEVAAHTIALVLALGRRLPMLDGAVRSGRWSAVFDAADAVRPSRTTLAVVGFGRIGSMVASFARALRFRVLIYDPYVDESTIRAQGHEPLSLRQVLAAADIVTLHVPLTDATHHLLDREAISTLKRGALVVNTCRGGLIDEVALAAAVRDGHLAGAGLDVFEIEPLPQESPLRGMPSVVLSPHAAWYSPDSLAELPRRATGQIVDFLAGRHVESIVNPSYVENLDAEGAIS